MQQVCAGATMKCSFGTAPAILIVVRTILNGTPIANIMDYKPFVNIPTFVMCSSLANPTVASATAAAAGVLTPMPCIPVTTAPWITGIFNVLIDNMPALNKSSTLLCSYGGVIQIVSPGQFSVKYG